MSWKFVNGQGSVDPGMGGLMKIFVRVVSPDGTATTTAVAQRSAGSAGAPTPQALLHPDARYRAVVSVPHGGIGRLEIGFRQHGITGFFPITNNPLKH